MHKSKDDRNPTKSFTILIISPQPKTLEKHRKLEVPDLLWVILQPMPHPADSIYTITLLIALTFWKPVLVFS